VVVAVVGPCAWPMTEVRVALGAAGCVALPHDPVSALLLRGGHGGSRRWLGRSRHPLLGAAHQLAAELERRSPATEPGRLEADSGLAAAPRGEAS
jgi:hypothetical protein